MVVAISTQGGQNKCHECEALWKYGCSKAAIVSSFFSALFTRVHLFLRLFTAAADCLVSDPKSLQALPPLLYLLPPFPFVPTRPARNQSHIRTGVPTATDERRDGLLLELSPLEPSECEAAVRWPAAPIAPFQ